MRMLMPSLLVFGCALTGVAKPSSVKKKQQTHISDLSALDSNDDTFLSEVRKKYTGKFQTLLQDPRFHCNLVKMFAEQVEKTTRCQVVIFFLGCAVS